MDVPPALRLLAAETSPEPSDAPEDLTDVSGGVPYDAGLQVELAEHGPEALQEWGQIVVRGCDDPARYNAAVWFALAQEPILHYELRDGCVIIRP